MVFNQIVQIGSLYLTPHACQLKSVRALIPGTKQLSAKADRFKDRKPLKVAVQAEAR